MSEEEPEELKAILIGNSGVGKTNLINTSVGIQFVETGNPTISGSFVSKIVEVGENKKFVVNLWDTAGQEAYKGVTKLFFKGSQIIILVYDIVNPESLESLKEWAKISEEIIEGDHIYGIVGNKNDLYLYAKVNEEEVKKFAESLKTNYKLVSAKTDPQSFIDYLIELVKMYKKLGGNEEKKKSTVKLTDNSNNNKKSTCCLSRKRENKSK
jgi:small GTP-binding protein